MKVLQGDWRERVLVARFKDRIPSKIQIDDNGCWLLTSSLCPSGYGVLSFLGKPMMAHRAAYMAFVGPIPDGFQVMHRCDVKRCINPAHLHLGHQQDNEEDKARRGRTARGTMFKRAVLTDDLVRKLRAEYRPGMSWKALELKYGINRGVIRPAVLGLTWRHVS